MTIISAYLTRHINWSKRTFGSGSKTTGLTKHIEKECQEIREACDQIAVSQDEILAEWIDIIILALDGYWRAGGKPHLLMAHLIQKQDINIARKWPPSVDGEPCEHIREEAGA